MASVSQSSSTKTSVTLYVSALNTASNYDTITITCNGVTSGNLAKGGTGQSTSNSVTFGSLTCGRVYSASAYLHTTAGSTGSASGNGTTVACAPTPSTIASVSLSATGTTTMSGSWGTSTNASTYSYELWRSGGSVVASNYSYGSTSQTFSGLTPNTAYYLKVWGRNVDNISGSPTNSSTVSTLAPVPSVPSLSLNSIDGKNISIQVSHSSDTTSIEFDYYWIGGYPDATKSVTGTSSTHTFTVPEYSTAYQVDCIARNSAGTSGWSNKLSFTSGENPVPPATPANFRLVSKTNTSFLLAWDSVTNGTYNIEVFNKGTTTNPVFQSYSIVGTSVSVTGLTNWTEYDCKLYAGNAYGNSTPTWLYAQRTADSIAPTINITSSSGAGTVNVQYSASDVGSGLRTPSRYAVHIGTANGGAGTTVFKEYTDNNYHTFLTDANGLAFVHNATYWVKVYAYDFEGNSTGVSVQITFTKVRPVSWEWHTAKVKGQPISITASEWNSFCTKINQFRAYKDLSAFSFTTAVTGSPITAVIFNQARSAIIEMSPPTAVPTAKTSLVSMFLASDFNQIRDSLNSIT